MTTINNIYTQLLGLTQIPQLLTLQLFKKKAIRIKSDGFLLSERRGSNPRPLAWKANALSAELLSLIDI